jgi:hypothetical protein
MNKTERKRNNKKHESNHRGNEYIILITRALGIGARLLNPRGYLSWSVAINLFLMWSATNPDQSLMLMRGARFLCRNLRSLPPVLDNTCVRVWNCLLSEQPLNLSRSGINSARIFKFCPPFSFCSHICSNTHWYIFSYSSMQLHFIIDSGT